MNVTTQQVPSSRRFNLGDSLILMGALALCLERFRAIGWFQSTPTTIAWCGQVISQLEGWSPWVYYTGYSRRQLMVELAVRLTEDLWLRTLCPLLFGLMMAQPLMSLRSPRPPLRQLVRQSGFATCLVCIATVVVLIWIAGDLWFSGLSLSMPLTRGILLLLIWPILGLPPWKAERSSIDRLGRAVGWGWIAAMAAQAVVDYLRPN